MDTKPITIDDKIKLLDNLVNLFIKMKSDPTDYIRKDGAEQHLEWAISHIAESIWQDSTSCF